MNQNLIAAAAQGTQMGMFALMAGAEVIKNGPVTGLKNKPLTVAPMSGKIGTVMDVPPQEIRVSAEYQREVLIGHCHDIAAKWDWRKYQPITVSMRPDGSLWCVDGQHRLTAAQLRGDISQLPCWVIEMSGPEEEAQYWVSLNKDRRRVKPMDEFRAYAVAKNPAQEWLHSFLQGRGLTLTGKTNTLPTECSAVSTCLTRLRCKNPLDGQRAIVEVFNVLQSAWGGQNKVYSGRVVAGMLRLNSMLQLTNRQMLHSMAYERLGRYNLEELMREAERVSKASGRPILGVLPLHFVEKFNHGQRKNILKI